ncbi:hypothetical protein B0H15DRAFT_379019 [Mycena belliarum]|uniref:Secreted protein n=1 Tax=Mycena belliarum TaxID=1033014 RepID=A0AAD6U1H7_9AGAR|nr:hypothetical protein B0H15DRAFT_379019 [Mycena belliae]
MSIAGFLKASSLLFGVGLTWNANELPGPRRLKFNPTSIVPRWTSDCLWIPFEVQCSLGVEGKLLAETSSS